MRNNMVVHPDTFIALQKSAAIEILYARGLLNDSHEGNVITNFEHKDKGFSLTVQNPITKEEHTFEESW